MKNKRKYQKPAMQVFELQYRTHLLQASRNDYDPTTWP